MKVELKQFVENAEEIGSSVLIGKSEDLFLSKVLQELMDEEKEIHIDKNILRQFPHLKNDLRQNGKSVCEDLINMENSRVGLCFAEYGIASTGSVCINIDKSDYNQLSLLPLKSIVLINSETVVGTINQIIPQFRNGNYVIVTGPSATADMGSLVKGAHGPAKLYIIILED